MESTARSDKPIESPKRRRTIVIVAITALVAVAAGAFIAFPRSSASAPDEADPAAAPYDSRELIGQLTFAVDPRLLPALAEVSGVRDGDGPRQVARVQDSDGRLSDLVLDEVLVSSHDPSAVEAFAARWNGSIIDVIQGATPDEPTDHLVRIDPTTVDVQEGPDSLLRLEPHAPGEMRFGSEAAMRLVAVAAIESDASGLTITPNWIAESASIPDGSSIEAEDIGARNAFEWSWVRKGGEQDIGLGPAWQLLDAEGKLDGERVRIMINDGGFYPNPDFPESHLLRGAKWGDTGDMRCTGGAMCPWHGSQVTMTAMGLMDNEYGVAGPAAPVAELIAVHANADSYKRLRDLRDMVEEHHPHIVNMSYGTGITMFRAAAEDTYERNYKAMANTGALLVAAAGNEGIDLDSQACIGKHCYESMLYVPCESTRVLCVGGMGSNATWKHDNSNFGSRPGDKSVELFGPYCVRTLNDPGDPYYEKETKPGCGTSHSSPFVAGIAGLLMAADPDLSASQVEQVLLDTAHVGGLHFDDVIPNEWQRRVDAFAAVQRVLGVSPAPPVVTIDSPDDGSTYSTSHWFELKATATSFAGGPLPVQWHSSLDGDLGTSDSSGDIDVSQLSEGDHVLTASATDLAGQTSEHWAVITVGNTPPTVLIGGGLDGSEFYEGTSVELIGYTQDFEHYGPLPDELVRWQVRRGGNVVFEADGHSAALPLATVTPGNYDVTFTAADGPAVTDEVSFTVMAIPAGENAPNAQIVSPSAGAVFGISGAQKAKVHLDGAATDLQDGPLDGTHFRWTAESQVGTEISLCEGSSVPGSGDGGGFLVLKNCDEIDVELDLDPAVGDIDGDGLFDPTLWTIKLTAYDSAGLYTVRSVGITVQVMVG